MIITDLHPRTMLRWFIFSLNLPREGTGSGTVWIKKLLGFLFNLIFNFFDVTQVDWL